MTEKTISQLEDEITELKNENIKIISCLVQGFAIFSRISPKDDSPKSIEINEKIEEYYKRVSDLLQNREEGK